MPDSATTTSTKNLSRPGIQARAPAAPASNPQAEPRDTRSLADLGHDELCELCDDLERWLDGSSQSRTTPPPNPRP